MASSSSSLAGRMQANANKNGKNSTKSTETTVFVRFVPPSTTITRFHLQDYFSSIGPIKKASVIRSSSSSSQANSNDKNKNNTLASYGFVKFVDPHDAHRAAQQENGKSVMMGNEQSLYRLTVELASKATMTTERTTSPSLQGGGDNKLKQQHNKTKSHNAAKAAAVPDGSDDKSEGTPSHKLTNAVMMTRDDNHNDNDDLRMAKRKRTNRVIVRNLSFYAKEQDIQKVLEAEFGPVCEVTLPKVLLTQKEHTSSAASKNDNGGDNTNTQKPQPHASSALRHRGFCFVTFCQQQHAQRAVEQQATPLLIKKRPVAIDFAVSKQVHQQSLASSLQQRGKRNNKSSSMEKEDERSASDSEEEEEGNSIDEADSSSDSDDGEEDNGAAQESNSDGDDDDASSSSDDDDDGNDDNEDTTAKTLGEAQTRDEQPEKVLTQEHDEAVDDHRSLFVRNLPFDASRHDLFELFSPFGRIESIHLVKDKNTGVAKGTAFCCFRDAKGAQAALEAASASASADFVTQREGGGVSSASSVFGYSAGLHLRGRRLFVDLAVDKKTAASLTVEKQGNKVVGKDRRNIYLKMEGRVASQADGASTSIGNNNAWENLPETDQQKRQRAFADKNTKLRSPLFFINPNRLSIRNLAKHVDEAMLKRLVVGATRRGLDTKLVSQEDQVAQWRAGGELTTRDIMKRIEEAKKESGSVIPVFDDRNVKRFIPSVFIDRDFSTNKKEKAPSRGFGFVDFEHHVHALACLRELNNNPYYSAEYVSGGKKGPNNKSMRKQRKKGDSSDDGRVLTPRLIVDFTVENKAKAKKQAEHRAHQLANIEKQRLEQREKMLLAEGKESKKEKKRSRGAVQREKKRKKREALDRSEVQEELNATDDSGASRQSPHAPGESEEDWTQKTRPAKPPKKKRKVDKDDQMFESLVDSYRKTFSGMRTRDETAGDSPMPQNHRQKKTQRRWFE